MAHPRMYEYEGILLSKHCVTVTLATKVLIQVDVGRDVQYFHSEGSSSYHCKNHLQHMQNRRVRIMSVYGNSVLLRALHGTTVGELSLITVYILSLYQLQYLLGLFLVENSCCLCLRYNGDHAQFTSSPNHYSIPDGEQSPPRNR
jgi:hypothetical protein